MRRVVSQGLFKLPGETLFCEEIVNNNNNNDDDKIIFIYEENSLTLLRYRYCRMLEEGSFRGRTADFVFMFIFGGAIMTVSFVMWIALTTVEPQISRHLATSTSNFNPFPPLPVSASPSNGLLLSAKEAREILIINIFQKIFVSFQKISVVV